MSDQSRSERSVIDLLISNLPQWSIIATLIVFVMSVLFLAGVVGIAIAKGRVVYIADLRFGTFAEAAGPLDGGTEHLSEAGSLPENIVVMTDGECSQLGKDWQLYGPIQGRFPIGAGQNTDASGNTKTFSVGQEDNEGEYTHRLTIAEMPRHAHGHNGISPGRHRCGGDCDGIQGSAGAVEAGGNAAHNNIPPYLVLNFCKKMASADQP